MCEIEYHWSLESLGIIVRKDAKNKTLDLLWSSSVTCNKANFRRNLRSKLQTAD